MKRFDMEIQPRRYYMGQGESYEVSPYESTNGEWVQWDDVRELNASNAKLIQALEAIIKLGEGIPDPTYEVEIAKTALDDILNNIEGTK